MLRSVFLTVCLLTLSAIAPARAQDNASRIVIDLGQHSASVRDIAISANGRFMVSVGLDETIRIWSLSSLKLEKTIRPPTSLASTPGFTDDDVSKEGQLMAVAISPDGTLIAVGGDIQRPSSQIYLFSASSGLLLRALEHSPDPGGGQVKTLEFVANGDGLRLVAGLSRGGGIAVWDIDPQAVAGEDGGPVPVRKAGRCEYTVEDITPGPHGSIFYSCARMAPKRGHVGWLNLDTGQDRIVDVRSGGSAGSSPWDVALSPDGSTLAVGFREDSGIQLFDISAASPDASSWSIRPKEARPDVSSTASDRTADFSRLAWSPDGRFLYGAGRYGLKQDYTFVQRWNAADWSLPPERIESTAIQTISALEAAPSGELLWGSYDSSVGLIGTEFQVARSTEQLLNDFRIGSFEGSDGRTDNTVIGQSGSGNPGNTADEFLVSFDGTQILTRNKQIGGGLLYFDLIERRLDYFPRRGSRTIRDLAQELFREPPPFTSTERRVGPAFLPVNTLGEATLSGWNETKSPGVSGIEVPIRPGMLSRSGTLFELPTGGIAAVLGTDTDVQLFTAQGEPLGETYIPGPGVAWRINASGDGHFIVAGFQDGTIRWIDTIRGEETLALLALADGRWVAWTPTGEYDASIGAEDLVGMLQVSQSLKSPVYYPIRLFREQKLDRERIATALDRKPSRLPWMGDPDLGPPPDATEPPSLLDLGLPPSVRILSSEPLEDGKVKINYVIDSPAGDEIIDLRVYVDGQPVYSNAETKNVEIAGATSAVVVPAPSGSKMVSIVAENRNGTSERAVDGSIADFSATLPTPPKKKRMIALVIGAKDYEVERWRLKYTRKDALDMARFLRGQQGLAGGYDDVVVKTIAGPDTDGIATRLEIERGLRWLKLTCAGEALPAGQFNDYACPEGFDPAEYDTTKLFYFSGHGKTLDDEYLLLPVDYTLDGLNGVSDVELMRFIRKNDSRKIIILDTCNAADAQLEAFSNEVSDNRWPTYLYMSSAPGTPSRESDDLQNSLFTQAFIEALADRYDAPISAMRPRDLPAEIFLPEEEISHVELRQFLMRRVKDIAIITNITEQEPKIPVNVDQDTPLFARNRDLALDNAAN